MMISTSTTITSADNGLCLEVMGDNNRMSEVNFESTKRSFSEEKTNHGQPGIIIGPTMIQYSRSSFCPEVRRASTSSADQLDQLGLRDAAGCDISGAEAELHQFGGSVGHHHGRQTE